MLDLSMGVRLRNGKLLKIEVDLPSQKTIEDMVTAQLEFVESTANDLMGASEGPGDNERYRELALERIVEDYLKRMVKIDAHVGPKMEEGVSLAGIRHLD